jgi:hypothetical protein
MCAQQMSPQDDGAYMDVKAKCNETTMAGKIGSSKTEEWQ